MSGFCFITYYNDFYFIQGTSKINFDKKTRRFLIDIYKYDILLLKTIYHHRGDTVSIFDFLDKTIHLDLLLC